MAFETTLKRDNNHNPLHDPLSQFKISDQDVSGDPMYYGYLAHDGGWYIMKQSVADNQFRYATGKAGYATAWSNRASLGYDYFSIIF